MSLRACTDYVAGVLNGQKYPNFKPLAVWTEFQARHLAGDTPQLWVVPAQGEIMRESMPRGYAIRDAEYKMHVYVELIFRSTESSSFRDLLNAVMVTLRTVPVLPVGLVDAQTGETSNLVLLGETMHWNTSLPVATKHQGLTGYNGMIEVDATEYVTGR